MKLKREKQIYREKRNFNDVIKRELHNTLYIKQKKIVQTKIREHIYMKWRSQMIYDNINKLRGKITHTDLKKVVL